MSWEKPNTSYWDNKLAAYWHDPIDKVFDIRMHEERAAQYLETFGIPKPNDEFWKKADAIASGFERGQVPSYDLNPLKSGAVDFCEHPKISHPTSSSGILDIEGLTVKPEKIYQDLKKFLKNNVVGKYSELFKGDHEKFVIARFLYTHLVLRFVMAENNIGEIGGLWHRIPADSRFPDHSIWNHNGLCSALYSCMEIGGGEENIGLMVFSITPVQSFISKARKLRDYWAGSVILSWLAFEGIRWITENLGPDHILYPSLIDQPLISEYLEKIWNVKDELKPGLWEKHPVHIASFPNKFLFLIPLNHAEEIAENITKEINNKWEEMSLSVKDYIFSKMNPSEAEKEYISEIFKRQTGNFWDFNWSAVKLIGKDDKNETAMLLDESKWKDRFDFLDLLQEIIKSQNYPETKGLGVLYSVSHTLVQSVLASEKMVKTVKRDAEPGEKCQLCGEFEVLHSKSHINSKASDYALHISNFWKMINENAKSETDFKDNEKLCSICLIKRWACYAINKKHILYNVFKTAERGYPSTTEIALNDYFKRGLIYEEDKKRKLAKTLHDSTDDKIKKIKNRDRYYAILVMDGDNMGKLINGETIASTWKSIMHPVMINRLGHQDFELKFKKHWGKIFEKNSFSKRVVTPSIHSAISEALGDFSIYGAAGIVNKYEGKLIYAGGDDVCAVLPVSNAFKAAREISSYYVSDFRHIDNEGESLIVKEKYKLSKGKLSINLGKGKDISISAGILICHHKESLSQMIERAHDLLNKKAKNEAKRNACAIELRKRHGGSRYFVRKWDDPGWDSFEKSGSIIGDKISNSLIYNLENLRPGIEAILKTENADRRITNFIRKQIERSGIKVENKDNMAELVRDIIINKEKQFNPEGLIITAFIAGGEE